MPRIRSVLRKLLSEEEFRRLFETPPPPKIVTLVELAQKTEKTLQKAEEESFRTS
jgi:hypothetical protein